MRHEKSHKREKMHRDASEIPRLFFDFVPMRYARVVPRVPIAESYVAVLQRPDAKDGMLFTVRVGHGFDNGEMRLWAALPFMPAPYTTCKLRERSVWTVNNFIEVFLEQDNIQKGIFSGTPGREPPMGTSKGVAAGPSTDSTPFLLGSSPSSETPTTVCAEKNFQFFEPEGSALRTKELEDLVRRLGRAEGWAMGREWADKNFVENVFSEKFPKVVPV